MQVKSSKVTDWPVTADKSGASHRPLTKPTPTNHLHQAGYIVISLFPCLWVSL